MKIKTIQAPTKLYVCKHRKWDSYMIVGNNNLRTSEMYKSMSELMLDIQENGLDLRYEGPFHMRCSLSEFDRDFPSCNFLKQHIVLKEINLQNITNILKYELIEDTI